MSAYRHYCLRVIRDGAWAASLEAERLGDRAEFHRQRVIWQDACEQLAKIACGLGKGRVDHAAAR